MSGGRGERGIVLPIEGGRSIVFEIDLDAALALVPAEAPPVEVRLGIGLASLIHFRVGAGADHEGEGELPAYDELVFGVHVAPHLGWDVPRFAVFVVSMAVSLPAAGRFLSAVHRMPVHPGILGVRRGPGGALDFFDEAGEIAAMGEVGAAPAPTPGTLHAHVFAADEGALWGYPESLVGAMARHQPKGRPLRLARHPFFRGAPLPAAPVPYLQTVGGGEPMTQVADRPVRIRTLRGA